LRRFLTSGGPLRTSYLALLTSDLLRLTFDACYPHPMPWPDAAYPKTVALRDGTEVLVRRLAAGDEDALLSFFQAVPAAERVVVAQDYRHRGLGTALLSELLDVARDSGLSGVLFEAVADAQAQALAAAESLGFIRLGLVHGGAIDPDGRLHDVVLLVMPLRRWRSSADF